MSGLTPTAPTATSGDPPAAAAKKQHSHTPSRESSEFEFVGGQAAVPAAAAATTAEAAVGAPPTAAAATTEPTATAPSTQQYVEDSNPGNSLLGWVKGRVMSGDMMAKVQSGMESVITTLDPQMKDYIRSGGDTCVVVASDKDVKVSPVRQAFQQVFGRATVFGVAVDSVSSTIANQPVGFAAGRQAAHERIAFVRNRHSQSSEEPVVILAVEGFLLEVNEDDWVEMGCLSLIDDTHRISMTGYTQPTAVSAAAVESMKEATPDTDPKKWSGFAKTVGQAVEEEAAAAKAVEGQAYATRKDWHLVRGGVARSDLIRSAAISLAHQYKEALESTVGPSSSANNE